MQWTRPDDITALGTIMGIWAHPDDETFTMAGILAAAAANGQTTICITATKGEDGSQDPIKWPPEKLGAVRAAELHEALRILGVTKHHWLDYADGGCNRIPDEVAAREIMPLIEKYQPDTIFTFPPDGLTGHEDHKSVCRWARLAAAKSTRPITIYYGVTTKESYQDRLKAMDEKLNIFYKLDHPKLYPEDACDLVFHLPKDILDKKCQSFAAMPSQTAVMLKLFSFDDLRHAFASECFIKAKH